MPVRPRRLLALAVVAALLVRARAGEEAARREAEARGPCDEFGLDFEAMQRDAASFPYTPDTDGAG